MGYPLIENLENSLTEKNGMVPTTRHSDCGGGDSKLTATITCNSQNRLNQHFKIKTSFLKSPTSRGERKYIILLLSR